VPVQPRTQARVQVQPRVQVQVPPRIQPAQPRVSPVKEQPHEQNMPDLGSLPPAARSAYMNGTIK
ncbi:MAG: hypothetical protein J5505_01425, partial [Spirochaetaceae bacterium]|nr:hypothetical protein [Spirochaetaceae bacterium]